MNNKKSLGFKFSCRIIAIMAIFCLVLVLFSYQLFRTRFIEFYEEKAQNICRVTAELVDGDKISTYAETLEKDDYYAELEQMFAEIKEKSGVAFLYMFAPADSSFTYLIDGKASWDSEEDIAQLGQVYEYSDTEYQYLVPDVKNKRASNQVIQGADVGFGRSVNAWAPVLDSDGNLVAMVEADYYLTEVYDTIYSYELRIALLIVIGLLVILGIILWTSRTLVVTPLAKLTGIVSSYQSGKLSEEYRSIQTGDEMQTLAETFGAMSERIGKYIENIRVVTAEKERIGAELNVATQIQADMLPSIFPAFPERNEFEIYATMTPAKEVGGDFYDFFMVDENHLAMVMADVSGKGVPAAMFMMISKTLLKSAAQSGLSPKEVLETVNNQLCENNDAEMFVTVWIGIMEISTGKMICSNAGHEYPAIKRRDGSYELFRDKHGFVLAGMENSRYREYELQLEPGDAIFVYTDGVPEATNAQEELYGTERMIAVLNEKQECSCQEWLELVHQAVNSFVGEAPQFDDITMLCLKYEGSSENRVC